MQVGALSLVFVPRVEAIQQPQAQIGFPFVKKSVRHLYLLTHIPDGSVFMCPSYHKGKRYTRLDKRENSGFTSFFQKIFTKCRKAKIKADKTLGNGYNNID